MRLLHDILMITLKRNSAHERKIYPALGIICPHRKKDIKCAKVLTLSGKPMTGFVISQDLTQSRKDHKDNLFILNELFPVALAALRQN